MPTRQERSISMPKNLKLKAARAEKDMTQGALAEAAGVSRQTIKAMASGCCGAAFWRRGSCRRCSGLRTRLPESGSYS